MNIGIDFGTTNTVVAVSDENRAVRVLPLDASANADALRTMLYFERDGDIYIGADAIHKYYAQHVGRVPRLSSQWIGFLDVDIAEFTAKGYEIKGGSTIVDVYADVDAESPGRLLHALKTPLASNYRGTKIFGKFYALEELIAQFLRHVRERVEHELGESVTRATFGRPVNFVGASDEAANQRAESRLRQAAELAGFAQVDFVMEPIAAGRSFTQTQPHARTILIFDFGGGTLDVAILQRQEFELRVLATGGVGIAGDHFDQLLFKRALWRWFGQGVKWGEQKLDFPQHMLDALGDWQDVPTLCNLDTLNFLRQAQGECSDPARLMALESLIFAGHAYPLYERVEQCKAALSSQRWSLIEYEAAAIAIWQPIMRAQFETYLAPARRAIERMLLDTLARAHVGADEIDLVVRTGGSSSIPLFIDLLQSTFGRAQFTEHDLFTSVARGLALSG
jgi:hypothetical chaperone protein